MPLHLPCAWPSGIEEFQEPLFHVACLPVCFFFYMCHHYLCILFLRLKK
jgi:hypothetical protein